MDKARRALAALAAVAMLTAACTTTEEDEAPAGDDIGQDDPDPASDEAEGEEEEDEAPSPLETEIAEIVEQVSVLRELPLLEPIETRVVGSDELAGLVTERGTEAESAERTAAAERVLIVLRHLSEDTDLRAVYDELLSTAVVGLYDPQDAVAYVSSEPDEPLPPAAASTAAHELLHALQDQHFDLTRLEALSEEDGDGVLAFLSVVEGDAMLLEEEWSVAHQSEEDRVEAEREQLAGAERQLPRLQEAPPYIVESFIFPYVAGERFVAELIGEGGYEAVNAALEDPPTTTLEILEPQRYLEGFEPMEVQAGSAPGDDWETLFASTFGAFDLLALFGSASAPEAVQGSTAWPAWRGGALEAWERGDDVVVAAAWTFADVDRAATVCEALPSWYVDVADATAEGEAWHSHRDVLAVGCEGNDVRFALAPDEATAQAALVID